MNYPQTHSDYLSYLSYFLVYCVIGIIYLKRFSQLSLKAYLLLIFGIFMRMLFHFQILQPSVSVLLIICDLIICQNMSTVEPT